MSQSQSQFVTRSIEAEMGIDAPVEAVWKALTDAEELTRWFPLEARVEPGAGGFVWAYYGESVEGEERIEIWEPNRHLRLSYRQPSSGEDEAKSNHVAEAYKQASNQSEQIPQQIATDYFLEGRGGKTWLRLVHSGFGADAVWDNLYEATRKGWKTQLRGLRHYLERHLGTPRSVAQIQFGFEATSLEEAWRRLMSADGLLGEGSLEEVRDGDRYEIKTAAGDVLKGVVCSFEPPAQFNSIVENMNDAYLMIHLDPPLHPGGENRLYVWLSTWGLPESQVTSFRDHLTRILQKLFPQASIPN